MLSLASRVADRAIGLFLPKAEANADSWGAYCYCGDLYPYYEYWVWTASGPKNVGCRPRTEWVCV